MFLMIIAVSIFLFIPNATLESNVRIASIYEAVRIWLANPLGIAWGTFSQFRSTYLTVSPHNWPAVSLIYGGLVSFFVVISAHVFCVRAYLGKSKAMDQDNMLFQCLLCMFTSIIAASWFEQVFQTANIMFIFMVAFAYLFHLIGQQNCQR